MIARRSLRLALGVLGAVLLAQAVSGVVCGATNASAQESQLQVTSVVTDGWPSLQATVTVLDSSGEPVTGLTSNEFVASIEGEAVAVTDLTTTSDPSIGVAVVLAFDVSGSMAGEPLAQARVAGQALLALLGPTDQAAILSFSDQPAVVLGFTADKAALAQAIDSLVIGGNTSLYAAVQQGADLAQQAPLPRRSVVVLSDGVDFGVATTTRDASLAAASQSGAIFMTIGLGPAIDSEYLAELASLGSGQFLVAPDAVNLQALYTAVAGILRQQYVLTLDASSLSTLFSVGTLKVQAQVGGATVGAEATISAPAGVQPTVAPTNAETPRPTATSPPAAPEGAQSGGSSSGVTVVIVAGLAVITLLGGVATLFYLRRVREGRARAEIPQLRHLERQAEPGDFPTIERAVRETQESGPWLELPGGDRFPLTDEPITIGFTPDCSVQLLNGTAERGRIWRRDGRYMLHNLSRLGAITVAGRPISWVILEDGDEIALGSATVVFREPPSGAEI